MHRGRATVEVSAGRKQEQSINAYMVNDVTEVHLYAAIIEIREVGRVVNELR